MTVVSFLMYIVNTSIFKKICYYVKTSTSSTFISIGAPVGDVWKFPNKVNSLITLYTNFYILEDTIDK